MTEVWNAFVENCFYFLYRNHRSDGLRVCDANRALLEAFLNEHVLECNTENLEAAYNALSEQLARETNPKPVAKPVAPEPESPPAEIDEQKRLKSLSKEELRQIVRSQRRYQTPGGAAILDPLPTKYDAATIRALSAKELSKLIQRFGGSVVTARLQGRS